MTKSSNTMDPSLRHVFEIAELNSEEVDIVTSQLEVTEVSQLVEKQDDLKYCEGFKRARKATLQNIILWYKEYKRAYRTEPDPLHLRLTEDGLYDFIDNGHRIILKKDAGLVKVFNELSWSEELQKRCGECGIEAFTDVLERRTELEEEKLPLPGLRQKELAQVADWWDDFAQDQKREPDLVNDFNEETFGKFVKRTHTTYDLPMEAFCTLAVSRIHGNDNESSFFQTLPEKDRPRMHRDIVENCVRTIEEQHISQELKKNIPAWTRELIISSVMSLLDFPTQEPIKDVFVVAGKTQSGKSSVKAILLAVCRALKVPVIVITKGVGESKELLSKFKKFTKTDHRDLVVGSPSLRKTSNCEAELKRTLESGGAFTIADTHAQVSKAVTVLTKYWQGKKFVAIVDEADAMYRTATRTQRFEEAFDDLMALNPSARLLITATPVPALLSLADEGLLPNIKLWMTTPCDDYVGVEEMCPLQDDNGNSIFLEGGELKKTEGFPMGATHIPYTNDNVMRLYQDAAWSNNNGVLLLDCTNPFVYTDYNVQIKAELVQLNFQESGKAIAVVTYVGKGISIRLPSGFDEGWMDMEKHLKMCDVLDFVDGCVGSDVPIFVFGFSKMRRGISYRSESRVPSHIVLAMGQGHCIENVVQTIGRGTFIGKSVLMRNGHSHVTVLTTAADWDMVCCYQRYVSEIHHRITLNGQAVQEAMTGASQKLPASTNFFCHTNRRIGQRPKRSPFVLDAAFDEATELTDGDKALASNFLKNLERYRVARICWLLWMDNGDTFFAPDVVEAYNDQFDREFDEITKKRVNEHLGRMVQSGLLEDRPKEAVGTDRPYSLEKTFGHLQLFLKHVEDQLEDDAEDDSDVELVQPPRNRKRPWCSS